MKRFGIGIVAAVLAAPLALAADDMGSGKSLTDLDTDKDGRVSRMEAMSDSQWSASFAKADTDGDGYLSQSEFTAASASMKSADQPQSSSDTSATAPSTSSTSTEASSSTSTSSDATATDDTQSDTTRTAESESATTPPRR